MKYIFTVKVIFKLIKFFFLKNFYNFEELITSKQNFKKQSFKEEYIFKYSIYIFKKLGVKSCFTKSLVLREILQENGFHSNIEIGVKRQNEKMISHCWVVSKKYFSESREVRKSFRILVTK